MIDLERVNRGEVPVAGLTAPLDRLAQQAAVAGTDPAIGFGDIWEGARPRRSRPTMAGCTTTGTSASTWTARRPPTRRASGPPGHHFGRLFFRRPGGRRRFRDRAFVRQFICSRPGRLCPRLEAGVQLGRQAAVLPRPARPRASCLRPRYPAFARFALSPQVVPRRGPGTPRMWHSRPGSGPKVGRGPGGLATEDFLNRAVVVAPLGGSTTGGWRSPCTRAGGPNWRLWGPRPCGPRPPNRLFVPPR